MSSKKATKAQAAEATYEIRDIVLAKVKGYPPWPAMIVDPETVNAHVKKERPQSKKTTFYCVRFFPAGDYSWAVAKDLSRLQTHEIQAYVSEPSKKNGDLKRGYEIALNPGPWEEELKRRQDQYEAQVAEEEEGVDQLDDSDGGEDEVGSDDSGAKKKKKAQVGKKRKRESISAEDQKKRRKSAQEALSAKRRPSGASKKKSKEHIESEDGIDAVGEGDEAFESAGKKTSGKGSKKGSESEGKKSKKDKDDEDGEENSALAGDPEAQRVKEWRHKLQRGFLTGKPPSAADMPTYDQVFRSVETYEGFTVEYLQFSKIGKVMRRITNLPEVPRDDEFHFKQRAQKLVSDWQTMINKSEQDAHAAKLDDAPAKDEKEAESPKVNGDSAVNGAAPDSEMVNGDAKPEDDAKKDEPMDMSDS